MNEPLNTIKERQRKLAWMQFDWYPSTLQCIIIAILVNAILWLLVVLGLRSLVNLFRK